MKTCHKNMMELTYFEFQTVTIASFYSDAVTRRIM